MFVLSRKRGDVIVIEHGGERLELTLVKSGSYRACLGFEGPRSFLVLRKEVLEREEYERERR